MGSFNRWIGDGTKDPRSVLSSATMGVAQWFPEGGSGAPAVEGVPSSADGFVAGNAHLRPYDQGSPTDAGQSGSGSRDPIATPVGSAIAR